MSVVLHRAERADVLADALAAVLSVPLADPFGAEVVAVHSRGIERWLSHRLASQLGTSPTGADGVCANLEFPFPGRLVGSALASATGVDYATDPWRPERLAWPLLAVVEAEIDQPWLSVLAGHLGAGADAHGRPSDRDRRFGAVRHVADLYDRYAVHRPEMVLAWAAGEDTDGEGAPLPADARWQAQLWRSVRAAVGAPSPPERSVEGCAALVDDPGLSTLPERIALFGLTRLPASYLEVLVALAEHRDVHVCALHPSPRAWDEVAALVAQSPDTPTDHPAGGESAALDAAVANPLLRSWGRDSREMQVVTGRRLRKSSGAVRVVHHPLPDGGDGPPGDGTLLAHLQSAIRADRAPEEGEPFVLADDDRSVQVHACHGRARQAEVVRDAVLHLLETDTTLEPRDVVVMCPDIDEMAPLLRAAFDATDVPHRLADRAIRQTNPLLGAIAALLELLDSRLTVSQVLTFASLAPVRARFRFDDDDLDRLAEWVRATGIRWGLDADHRAIYDLGSVPEGTWDAGLERILLGVAMTEDDQRLVGGVLPLDDVEAGDIDLAGRLAELVGRLGEVVEASREPRGVAAWVSLVHHAADLLVHTTAADAWQRAQLDRLLTAVLDEAAEVDGPALRLAELRDLLDDRLRGQPSRAAFRTGDLTMCTLVPMRSVPHRVVCLVGLDDGAFPRGGVVDGDDLLVRSRHLGDHDRRSEDRQLLLDAVLAATDALVITYAGRDVRTNEERPPAVPLVELLDVVDATARSADGRPARDQVEVYHPLRSTDPVCFTPGALGTPGPWSFEPHLLDGARSSIGPVIEPRPFLDRPLPARVDAVVELDDLVRFVQHPVRAFLGQRLGVSLWVDDDRAVDALPIEMDHLEAWAVGDRLLTALLAGGDLDAVCAAERARGLLPPGAMGGRVMATARERAAAIAAEARAVADGARTSLEVDVDLGGGRRLVGTVPDVVGDVVRAVSYSKIAPKRRLAAWVRYLAAVASHPGRPLRSVTVGWGRGAAARATVTAVAPGGGDQSSTAVERLVEVVDLRDRALCEPIPLFCETSWAYATARAEGNPDAPEHAAQRWTSTWDWTREDRDAEHVLAFGGERSWRDVLAEVPRDDEGGPGWPAGEPTRFGLLARRLCDPVLAAPAAATDHHAGALR